MKQLVTLALALVCMQLSAQTLHLKTAEFVPITNVNTLKDFATWPSFQNKTYCIVQFSKSTSATERAAIEAQTGIEFLNYIPKFAFIAAVPTTIDIQTLGQFKIRSIVPYQTSYKIYPKFAERPFPTWMVKSEGRIEVLVEIYKNLSQATAEAQFAANHISFISWKNEHNAIIEINETELNTIATFPWVKYIQFISTPGVPENLTERTDHRVNTINTDYVSGIHYDGTGVSVAVGDDGFIGPHIDFKGRLTHHPANLANTGTHADHVCGIVAGGGNFDPVTSGNGRGADLHVYSFYNNLTSANTDYNGFGVRITSNSLGQTCNDGYTTDAQDADILVNSKYSLMSVHSAGNSGGSGCGGVGPNYFTITGGYKCGKNVITVGNVDNSDVIDPSSSRGPAEDGRIKPEVVAVGTNVYSTQPDNTYASLTGTSMACPGVAGTLASLWQAYRNTHANTDPPSDLMKCLLMNTADDLGTPGPDFTYGFGRINARRALNVMTSNQYIIDSVDDGNSNTHVIAVPANVAQLKVMIYWNDVDGTPGSAIPLVNNIKMKITTAVGNTYNPWVLNTTHTVAALSAAATRNTDAINNEEQITIDTVGAGNYTISITGEDVPFGPQKYVICYEFIMDTIVLTYPTGGESFVDGVTERIRWDAKSNIGNFTLRYSTNGGATYNNISNSISGSARYYDWTPPAGLNTGQMQMRISRFGKNDKCDTLFSVIGVPQNVRIDTACGTLFHLVWDTVASATGYKIFTMGPKYMTEIGTSTTNDYYVTGVNTTDTFYYAVSATRAVNGAIGRRSIAYQKLPGSVGCTDDAYNMGTILPFTSTYVCASGAVPIKVKIKNVGLRALVGLPVYYQVNATPVVSENLPNTLNVGDSVIYTFTTLANMSTAGVYNVKTWSSVYTDIILSNDTSQKAASTMIPVTIVAPSVEDFEGIVFPPNGWRVLDADTSVKWQKTICFAGASGGNTHSAYMDFFNYNNLKQIDDLETAQFDLTTVSTDSALVTFDVSHAYGPVEQDSLSVLVSNDCTQNFVQTPYKKGGASLATVGMMSSIFSPTLSSQWRNDQVDLTSYIGQKVFVRFRGLNGHGNNLFVDNINIVLKNVTPLSIDEFGDNSLTVYPNPSDGNYTLELNSTRNKEIRYTIYNVAGQKMKENRIVLSSGNTRTAINISELPSGMYLLELNDSGIIKNVKLSKY